MTSNDSCDSDTCIQRARWRERVKRETKEMSSIPCNPIDNSNIDAVMTPNEIFLGNSDDDVLEKKETLSNHDSYTSILALTYSTNQEEKRAVLNRDQLTPHDVILGRGGGHDKGPYADALKDWWQKYNAGTHSMSGRDSKGPKKARAVETKKKTKVARKTMFKKQVRGGVASYSVLY